MHFTYYPREGLIKSEDPAIRVEIVPSGREPGRRFVLCLGEKRIGFRTKNIEGEEQVVRLADGTLVWQIHDIGQPIPKWDFETNSRVFLTNTHKFSSQQEQKLALEIFSQALAVYDAGNRTRDSESPRAFVEYTPKLLEQISKGNLVE